MAEKTDFRTSSALVEDAAREGSGLVIEFPHAGFSAKFPPRRRPNLETRAREYLNLDEVNALADAAKRTGRNGFRDRLIVWTLFRHAFRVAELCRLTWDDITFARTCTMNVRRVKRGTPSTHSLSGEEIRELRQLQREQQPSRFVFTSERGTPISQRAVHHVIARAGEIAGIEFPVHPHMLRHAKGFRLASKGEDTRAIQAFFGHRRIESTVTYTDMDPNRFRDFAED